MFWISFTVFKCVLKCFKLLVFYIIIFSFLIFKSLLFFFVFLIFQFLPVKTCPDNWPKAVRKAGQSIVFHWCVCVCVFLCVWFLLTCSWRHCFRNCTNEFVHYLDSWPFPVFRKSLQGGFCRCLLWYSNSVRSSFRTKTLGQKHKSIKHYASSNFWTVMCNP